MRCIKCGGDCDRSRRKWHERALRVRAYRCAACGFRCLDTAHQVALSMAKIVAVVLSAIAVAAVIARM